MVNLEADAEVARTIGTGYFLDILATLAQLRGLFNRSAIVAGV
jgi:hypothetical protein